MSDLIVLTFDSEGGAMQLRDKLLSLQKQQIIDLADAAVVVRGQDDSGSEYGPRKGPASSLVYSSDERVTGIAKF